MINLPVYGPNLLDMTPSPSRLGVRSVQDYLADYQSANNAFLNPVRSEMSVDRYRFQPADPVGLDNSPVYNAPNIKSEAPDGPSGADNQPTPSFSIDTENPFETLSAQIGQFTDDVDESVTSFTEDPLGTIADSVGYGPSTVNGLNAANNLGALGALAGVTLGIPGLGLLGAGFGANQAANVGNSMAANSFGTPNEISAWEAFKDAISFGLLGQSASSQLSDLGAEMSTTPDGTTDDHGEAFGPETALGMFGVGNHRGETAFDNPAFGPSGDPSSGADAASAAGANDGPDSPGPF